MNITTLQWNPHYVCFGSDPVKTTCCSKIVQTYLKIVPFDFANVIALETCYKNVQLDSKYKILNSYIDSLCKTSKDTISCGKDTTSIIYDSSKWKTDNKAFHTCLDPGKPDRIALAYKFTSVKNPSVKIIVIGAHFSHDPPTALKNLNKFIMANNWSQDKIILLADTNIDGDRSDATYSPDYRNEVITQVLQSEAGVAGIWKISDPIVTCCYQDSGKPRNHMYDIVATNLNQKPVIIDNWHDIFMTIAKTITVKNPTCTALEMHDPLVATITIPNSELIIENFTSSVSKNHNILSIAALVLLGLCLLCGLAKMAMKEDKAKKSCDHACSFFLFLGVVLLGVSQLIQS